MIKPKLSNKTPLPLPTQPHVIARSVATKLSASETPHFGEAVVSVQSRLIANTAFALSLFCLTFLIAFISGSAFFSINNSSAASRYLDIKVNINSNISITSSMLKEGITVEDEVLLDITPTPTGTLTSQALTVTVSTNNSTGYTLTMNSLTNNTDLVNTLDPNQPNASPNPSSPLVPTLPVLASTSATTGSPAVLANNTWGYTLDTTPTLFARIPTLASPDTLKTTAAPDTASITSITFAANANSSIPAGMYMATIVLTATSNYVPPPPAIPPLGSYPTNIGANNAGVRDVYPTTGWGEEVVVITSNNLFTNVQKVLIGGTDCTGLNVINTSVIACKLPSKPAGTTHNIEVLNGTAPGTDVINAATYKHMKITYFDPSQTTITFADTATFGTSTFTYFPNGFTSSDCTGLTPDNTNNINIPDSIVFVRDTRNKQVYRVKKMVDNKCWMIDNLKYQGHTDRNGTIIQNYDGYQGSPITDTTTVSDGTAGSTGLVFRNGRGPNIPTTGTITYTYNTIDGTSTQSATNSDKAFWNNPMSNAGCYSGLSSGSSIMDANTLTHCGYFYNWFAATGGTGTYSRSAMLNTQATGSICPANFRLPSGASGTAGPTTDGGVHTRADFPLLNASMDLGSLATLGNTNNTFAGWQPGAQWSGTLSGHWNNGLSEIGTYGRFWSSTTGNPSIAYPRILSVNPTSVSPGSVTRSIADGLSVRCVMP